MLSKLLIQFSVEGRGCVPSLLFDLGPSCGGGNEDNVTSFKRSHAGTAIRSGPSPAAGHRPPTPPPETPEHSRRVWVSVLWGHGSFLLGPVHKVLLCLQGSTPQSCVSSGGSVVGEWRPPPRGLLPCPGLLHQSPCPCGRPLLTRTSSGDAHTQLCLSLVGSLGPSAHKVCLSALTVSGGNGV